jgi:hypothetical protein
MGFPAGWTAKNLAATTSGGARIQIWSLDGLKFDKKNGAFEFIGFKKLTDEMCNAIYHKLPPGWKASKEGTGIKRNVSWVCVNPEGIRFSSLKAARDSLTWPLPPIRTPGMS